MVKRYSCKTAELLRAACAALLLAMLFSLAACAGKQPKNEETAPETTSGQPEEQKIPYLDAADYGNTEFKLLTSTVSADGGRHFSEFGGDLAGDSIASAVYRRDRFLEEKYKIFFSIKTTTNWNTELEAARMSDDLLFHIATPGVSNAVYSISMGNVANLDLYPNFNFENPWWRTEAIEQMRVIGEHLLAIGDINLLAYDSVGVIFYNKRLADSYYFTDLYDRVNSGTWTYDSMLEYVAQVTADNGDGVWGAGDTYGLYGGSYSALCFTYGGNYTFVEKDDDGVPHLRSDLTDFINFFQKMIETHANESLIGYGHDKEDPNMFAENRLLFNINMLGASADLRALGADYGILPMPKWEISQNDYYAFPHQSASTTVCVPVSNREYDKTSRIVEDMAHYSYDHVLSCYVEENLFLRSLNGDQDSYNTVLKLLSNLNCDIFFSYRAGITQMLRDALDAKDPNIVSKLQKYNNSINKQLSGIVAGLLEKNELES